MRNQVPQLDPSTSSWIRLPKAGTRCPVSGFSRTGLVELVHPSPKNDFAPPVSARVVKRKGTQRGVLLISKESLLSFIAAQPAPGQAHAEEVSK